jgi:ubiquinone/menaquinone biosynthesis C-methylase UbiE
LEGGHAQVIPALQKLDSQITVTGSSEQCSLLLNRFTDNSRLRFVQAKMLNLPFENGSFEAVICLRQISHISDWKKLVAELCRISSGKVIIDYPPLCSFNFFYSLLFPLKKLFEKNTREFLVFTREQINAEFLRHGFKPGRVSPQFLLPMVVYRGLKNRKIAAALEKVFSSLRLTAAFGSPVIAEFTKLN